MSFLKIVLAALIAGILSGLVLWHITKNQQPPITFSPSMPQESALKTNQTISRETSEKINIESSKMTADEYYNTAGP